MRLAAANKQVIGKDAGGETPAQPAPFSGGRPELGLVFVLLVGMSVIATAFLPPGFFEFWRQLVMRCAALFGSVLGVTVTCRADILTVNGFAMQVIDECTALNYVIVLSTAMLLYARHSLPYRLLGVFFGVPAIVLANAFRLVVTGVAGTVSRKLFDFVHEYLWVALFALFIFALWKVWVDRAICLDRRAGRRIAVVLAACSAMFALQLAMMPLYGSFLATLSTLALGRMVDDGGAMIAWVNGAMQSVHGGTTYRVPFALGFFNVAVFAGLALPLQKRGDWNTLIMTVLCLAGAVLVNAFLIATAVKLMIGHGEGALAGFLFSAKALLIALPFAFWWIIAAGRGGRSSADGV